MVFQQNREISALLCRTEGGISVMQVTRQQIAHFTTSNSIPLLIRTKKLVWNSTETPSMATTPAIISG